MAANDLTTQPHRRFNLLTRQWILVSSQRNQRPWQGQMEVPAPGNVPHYDPACYMCPGNTRSMGTVNPGYKHVFVFDNDFPALLPQQSSAKMNRHDLLIAESAAGICRVICFSPRHDLTLSLMEENDIRAVVDSWARQFQELSAHPEIQYVQIFENRGAMMGASNPHPHGQIWATDKLPDMARTEQESQAAYREMKNSCLLCDYLALEISESLRIILQNQHFVVLVPYWAVWPFETMLLPRRHLASIDELACNERDSLSDILKQLTTRYDNLFRTSFPYSMGFHQRPCDGQDHPEWHFHAHFFPPLLRSATVRKFMVGFELLAMPQRDVTPETSAERLRCVPNTPAKCVPC